MKFGDNLKRIRKNKNISQEDLAEKLGVSRQSISKWETGENYPSMQNIMCLCTIFKCQINEIVHEDFEDINSLDEEIKMSVVKFKKEEQKKMKVLSKIIYIIARICKIVSRVGIYALAISMIIIGVFGFSTKIENNNVSLFNKYYFSYEIKDTEIVLNDNKEEHYITEPESYNDLKNVVNYIETRGLTKSVVFIELLFGSIIALLILAIKLLTHIEKLFININTGDTPFTLENVTHIRKMSFLMIALIIIPGIVSAFAALVGIEDVSYSIDGISLLSILILLSLSYIFKYGYDIQLDSKGKMYGETEE